MRFTIRDLLWLTVVVALGIAWWVDHHVMASRKPRIADMMPDLPSGFAPQYMPRSMVRPSNP